MKTQKKGFTLIELMVVIVIIGILAAIAIPKLFGMTAKAKAQEVGPAAGTWVKLQQAYNAEMSQFGGNAKISYIPPGMSTAAQSTGTNATYFTYDTFLTAEGVTTDAVSWTATVRAAMDKCPANASYNVKINSSNEVTATISNDSSNKDCETLTQRFKDLR